MLDQILHKALAEESLNKAELIALLSTENPEDLERLYAAAYEMKKRYIGQWVSIRGLIEISDICTKDCFYCGIRKSNSAVPRFAMSQEEILAAADLAAKFNYGSIVLQGGERSDQSFVDFITDTLKKIKNKHNLGITLSLGEQSLETFQAWREAGAHRYLLRIEASNPKLYAKLHPDDLVHDWHKRRECLNLLRKADYQVGTGVMIDLPYQTYDDLADDLLFFKEYDVDMLGMGPYLPHHQTPLGQAFPAINPAKKLNAGLKMIAAARLFLRDVNIASTTALQTLSPNGRERGLQAGANVIMPNIGDIRYRRGYQLYENKPNLDENVAESRENLRKALAEIGEKMRSDYGDSPHYHGRKQ